MTHETYTELRAEITQRREAAGAKRGARYWNPDKIIQAQLISLLDWLEVELDKVPLDFYKAIRVEVIRRREQTRQERAGRNWNSRAALKLSMVQLLDWIESELDKHKEAA